MQRVYTTSFWGNGFESETRPSRLDAILIWTLDESKPAGI